MKLIQVVIMDFLKLNPSDLCDRSDDKRGLEVLKAE